MTLGKAGVTAGAATARAIEALLVEDEAIIRLSLKSILTRLGVGVCGETDRAEDTHDLVRTLHPAVVFMDIKLKGEMSGIEAAEQISLEFGTPIIFMSAYDFEDHVGSQRIPSQIAYLKKPVTGAELKVLIETVKERGSRAEPL